MGIQQCKNGHMYDSKHPSCPFCSGSNNKPLNQKNMQHNTTKQLHQNTKAIDEHLKTKIVSDNSNHPKTDMLKEDTKGPSKKVCKNGHSYEGYSCPICAREKTNIVDIDYNDSGKTTPIWDIEEAEIKPVVGWLVCIEGNKGDRGVDYKLYPEWNKVGRSNNVEVNIKNDMNVSRDGEVLKILFDTEDNTFDAVTGSNIKVKINGKKLLGSKELIAGDIISFSDTQLIFVPFCNDKFSWDFTKKD